MASQDPSTYLESGEFKFSSNEMSLGDRTAPNLPPTSLRKKSDLSMGLRTRVGSLRKLLDYLLEVLLGTKLSVFFLAIPFAIVAERRNSSAPWVFALSLLGLIPLAERVSFLTEQIAIHTGPTVGGLLNATCGNATELIISIFALINNRVDVVKYSLFGSILSNLLLVLGSSLLCGGIANISKKQKFNKKQVDVNSLLLMMGLLCHVLPLMIKYAGKSPEITAKGTLELSRASSIIMLVAYFVSLFFQLSTNRKFFQTQQDGDEENGDDDDNDVSEEAPAVGFWSGLIWLALMTGVVALLSEYVVATIEAASVSWGLSVNFTSLILLPIVGNAVEHAAAIIFALRNKLDITLGVAIGSATQIAMFVVPLSVVISWIIGVKMDLDLSLLETIALALSILVTTFALQDGTSHYVKGLVLLLCYLVIGACFFIVRAPLGANFGLRSSHVGSNFS